MKRAIKIVISLFVILALLVGAAWYFLLYNQELTAEFFIGRGRSAMESGKSGMAIRYFSWAHQLSGQDESLAIELAEAYQAAGNYTKAEFTLANAIAAGGSNRVYEALCRVYVEQDKLLDAVTMLDQVADPTVKAQLDAVRPAAPTSDLEPGFYNQYMDVTLSGDGAVYIGLGSNYPSTATAYEGPISLEAGETSISALSIGDNGLVSPLAVFGYTVSGVVEEVQLSDAALDAYVRDLLDRSAGSPLTTADLWSITEMTIPEDVSDVTDLSYCTGLTALTIHDRDSISLAFLSGMSKLTSLDLSGCTIDAQDLPLIGSLPLLTDLNLSDCGLSTLAGLEPLTTLVSLNLSSNSISDLTPLAGNGGLSTLNLQRNAVTGSAALSGFPELIWLDISYNAVTDLSSAASCVKLQYLNISNNSLTALTWTSKMTALVELNGAYNQLADASGLGGCTALKKLDLSNNALTSMDALAALVNLSTLDISYNDILTIPDFPDDSALTSFNGCHNFFEDVSGLANLENLNYVYLDYNNVTDVNVLSSCRNLIQVNVFKTNVTDVSALLDMNVIVSYNPT